MFDLYEKISIFNSIFGVESGNEKKFLRNSKKQAENKMKNFFDHLSNSIKVIASHAVWRMILIRSLIKVCHKIGNIFLHCLEMRYKE